MSEPFTIGEHTYRITGKIDAFKQWEIVRRLSPAIVDLVGAKDAFFNRDDPYHLDKALRMVSEAIGRIPDADAHHIFKLCLCVTARQVGQQWAAVSLPSGQLMFDDITLPEVLGVTVRVIQEHLAGFTAALPSDLKAAVGA